MGPSLEIGMGMSIEIGMGMGPNVSSHSARRRFNFQEAVPERPPTQPSGPPPERLQRYQN